MCIRVNSNIIWWVLNSKSNRNPTTGGTKRETACHWWQESEFIKVHPLKINSPQAISATVLMRSGSVPAWILNVPDWTCDLGEVQSLELGRTWTWFNAVVLSWTNFLILLVKGPYIFIFYWVQKSVQLALVPDLTSFFFFFISSPSA